MNEQHHLFTPPEARRLSRQCELILARLRQGMATNVELGRDGRRFSARILELRRAGHRIDIVERDHATGVTVYELKENDNE